MDIDKLFEDELKSRIQEKLKKYENKIYLNNNDIMKELGISSSANLRKQLAAGKYAGLYEEKSSSEPYRWNKFKFFKWYFKESEKAIKAV